jgi:hypothetical protein
LILLPVCLLWISPIVSAIPSSTPSPTPELTNILLFSSWAEHLPWSKQLLQGTEQELMKQTDGKGNLFTEYLDVSRLKQPLSEQEIVYFLEKKYQLLSLDGVIVDSTKAVNLVLKYGLKIFGNLPYVLYSAETITPADASHLSTYAVITNEDIIGKTIDLAFQQNPETEHIIVIGDSSDAAQPMLSQVGQVLQTHYPDTSIITKTQTTVEDLEVVVSTAPAHTLVLFTLFFQDRWGQTWRPVDVVERLAAVTSAPIYVFHETLIGSGAVGGYVRQATQTGTAAVQAIARLKRQYQPGKKIRLEYDTAGTILDGRSLRKWHIPPSFVPHDADIRYRWSLSSNLKLRQRTWAISIVVITIVLGTGLLVMFWQRQRLNQDLVTLYRELGCVIK